VIWSLDPDKDIGPDGFSISIFWDLIKYAQKNSRLGGSTNSSFLSLVLKEPNPSSFNRFRPISFCNTSYKIMLKINAR
jgi:hypothetical protein